ncbi:MAG: mechanosensitive ion channel family protein [Candidatus Promineifilaceae bacterium]
MDGLQVTLDWANRNLESIVLGIISAIAIFIVGRWLAKLVARLAERWMRRAEVDDMVIRFAKVLIYTGLLVAVIIAALSAAGIQTTSLTALLASAGVALGLAVKDALANFASGVMILLFKPYRVGDYVEAGGGEGSVEEVSLFNTVLQSADNIRVIIPNSQVTGNKIKNYSVNDTRRVDLVAGIGYEDDLRQARDILMQILTSHELVLAEPAPTVDVLELADSSVNLAVRPWARTEDYWRVRCDVLEQMKMRFDQAGISLPHPQQDVYVHQVA